MPKRSAPVLTALVLLFTLSGCGICGKYEAADKEAAAGNLLRESGTESDSASIAGLDWKELFTDPCLQALIDTGLARNTDLQTAKLQVEEAAASLYKARMNYLPALSLFAEGGLRSAEGSEATYSYEFGLDASWDPVTFGRKANAKRSSAAALAEAAAFEQAVRTRLIATIAESYCTLLMLDEQLAISRRTKENWDETVSTLEALVLAGQSREVAVHQARASRAAIEAAALTIEKSIFETENSLCALLRKNSTEIPRLSLSEQEFPQELNVGLPVAILSGRPDVRQAEAALAKAFYGLNGAKADLYPSLSLSGSIGWTSEGGLKVSNPGKIIESLLGSLVEPLLSGGSRRAEVKIAEAKLKEAELAFEQAVLTAGNEVNDALKDAQTAEGKIILDCRQVDELNEAVTKTWYLVRYSDANYLELLNAKQSLFNAELTLAQDRTERLLSVIRLYCALGGGSLQSPASTGEKQ
ncbi:MAG: efflux transporter outer membrane subunit [Candidatus Cryptobacteroides sp.]